MKGNTQKGLYFLIIGFLITTIFTVINSISNLFTQDIALIIIGFAGSIALVGFILILIGAVFFLIGKEEFGKTHEKNVEKAVIIFVLNFVVTLALSFLLIVFAVLTVLSSSTPGSITGPLPIITIAVTVVAAVLGGLLYYFALRELENETGKTVLYAAIMCSIVVSVLTSVYVAGVLGERFGLDPVAQYQSANPFMQNVGIIGLLALIPSILFIYAMYIPYTRIKNGELTVQFPSNDQSSSSNRFCTNCGRNIPFDAVACSYCGKRFEVF